MVQPGELGVPCGTKRLAKRPPRARHLDAMPNLSPKLWALVKSRYMSGEGIAAIASDLQLNEKTLRCRATKEGLPKKRQLAKNALSDQKEPPVGAVSKPSGNSPVITRDSVDSISQRVRSRLAANIEATVARADSYAPADLREENQLETVLASVTKRAATVFGWSESQASTLVSVNLLGALPDREIVVSAAPDAGPADPG